ncbi:MAG: EAL domain-containing protein [Acidobacteriaceae bacterium]
MTFLLKADIAAGLRRDEFFPVFQPLVELRTGQIAGFEALARWNYRRQELLMPADFIPVVEGSGLIDGLTITILNKAFTALVLAKGAFMLSVNLSPLQLRGSNLAARIAATAAEAGFPLDRLTIEITESALVNDLPSALQVASELKAMNCKLALDDFGTGYSSLQHLHSLPFDELKVDRSFVSSMTEKRESRKIVAAVVGLGHSLELLTVAEGVETQEQANMLLWLGCDLGQGWLYGKPVAAAELPGMIAGLRARTTVAVPVPLEEGSIMSLEALPTQRLAQLQAIYDGAPVGLCFLDRKLRYVSLNKRLAQLNGVPASAHLGRTVAEILPHFFPRIEPFLRRALQGEPMTGIELQRTMPGGSEISLLASYQPARDEAGEVVGVSVAIMDVTHARRTEKALQEAENHYRHMMQLSPNVPWVLNNQGEVTDAGFSKCEEFTGQRPEEALGNGWLKMLHPDDVEPTREAIRHTLETGEPIDIRYRIRRPNEEWKWMRSRGSPRFALSGEIVGIYGVLQPDDEKQISEELERCHIELQAALNAVPVGIILADAADGAVIVVNPKAYEILRGRVFPGQKLMEYKQLRVLNLDGTPIPPDEFSLVRSILRGETIEARDMLFERPNGTRAHLVVSSRPIDAVDGHRIGALAMIQELEA